MDCYASRKPDPEATCVDAFSIKWNDHLLYTFLLFSLIARCFQKIEMEKSELIVPMLDTQPRYSQLLRMLTDVPRTLPQRPDTPNARKEGNDTRSNHENDIDGLQSIRRSLETQGISKRASDIILQSWK